MYKTANEIFRNWEVDGVPSSGNHEPELAEIRAWGSNLEGFLGTNGLNAGLVFSTQAALFANIAKPANTLAWVVQDPIVANNGIYLKQGGSGSGSWVRAADLPYSFILATDVGSGNPDAILATSSIPVSSSTMVIALVYADSVGSPVTISFNGDTPLTIKTNSGNDIDPGGIKGGSAIWGIKIGNTFRLANDEAIANVVAGYRDAALTAVTVAQAARDAALGYRNAAQVQAGYSADSATQAATLVAAAQAGFTGFPSTAAYDFGSVADPVTYFNQDWGTL